MRTNDKDEAHRIAAQERKGRDKDNTLERGELDERRKDRIRKPLLPPVNTRHVFDWVGLW